MASDLDTLLPTLDQAIQTADDLAVRLGWPSDRVDAVLAAGVEAGLVLDWDPDFATSWLAKRRLHPVFFAQAVPASIGVGAMIGAVWLAFEGSTVSWVVALGLMVVAGALGWVARHATREATRSGPL